jgi:hypothetical protein
MKRHAAKLVALLGFALLAYGAIEEKWRVLVPVGTALLLAAFKVDNVLRRSADPGRESGG